MRLSEAIREGAKLRPQARGAWFGFVNVWRINKPPKKENDPLFAVTGEVTIAIGSCALAAAGEGATLFGAELFGMSGIYESKLINAFPLLKKRVKSCPACGRNHTDLLTTAQRLNDAHGWKREQIADYIETLEVK